jgi:uncharacterized protein (DUF1697 family)
MPRYVALLRGVSPMNLRMPDLKKALESAGFTNVKTLLSSGNAAFDSRKAPEATLEKKIEKTLVAGTSKEFLTLVRSQEYLNALLEADAYAKFKLGPKEKKVVTFLKDAPAVRMKLPVEGDGARILAQLGREVYMTYVPNHPKGAVFMRLLERTLGKGQTTRTWDTVRKCATA